MFYEKPLIIDFGSITEHTFTGGNNHPSPADGDDDDGDDDEDD